jgi:hypothetical protein
MEYKVLPSRAVLCRVTAGDLHEQAVSVRAECGGDHHAS